MRKNFVRMFPALKHLNIPNALTTFGMVFGIVACFFLTRQNFRMAVVCLALAGLMDFIDGFVATKLNQQTTFGQYVDTLVDFFTCGIIPVWMVFDLLVYESAPLHENIIIVAALIFYSSCALWRLAYYNIVEADKFFVGLPVPGAMMIITSSVWAVWRFEVVPVYVAAVTFFIIGTLMVSGINLPKYGIWQKALMALCAVFVVIILVVG